MFGIGRAVKEMWNGNPVSRLGWNGENVYILIQIPDEKSKMTRPYVFMKTVDNMLVPWVCSQSDLLAEDWEVVQFS